MRERVRERESNGEAAVVTTDMTLKTNENALCWIGDTGNTTKLIKTTDDMQQTTEAVQGRT